VELLEQVFLSFVSVVQLMLCLLKAKDVAPRRLGMLHKPFADVVSQLGDGLAISHDLLVDDLMTF